MVPVLWCCCFSCACVHSLVCVITGCGGHFGDHRQARPHQRGLRRCAGEASLVIFNFHISVLNLFSGDVSPVNSPLLDCNLTEISASYPQHQISTSHFNLLH